MIRAALLSALALAGFAARPAVAQTMYGGYDVDPNYGAMLEFMQRQQQQQQSQIPTVTQQIVQRAMQDPICRAHYQAYQQRGGRMPFPNFAYQCAATANFSPEGMQRYWQTQQDNQRAERDLRESLRRAEQAWPSARPPSMDRHGQAEDGRLLQGNQ